MELKEEEPITFKGFDFESLSNPQYATEEEVENYVLQSEAEKKLASFRNSGVGKKYLVKNLDDFIEIGRASCRERV